MKRFKTLKSYTLYTLLCVVLLWSCNDLKKGTITSITYIKPHNKTVTTTGFSTGGNVVIGTAKEYVPDTTYFITIEYKGKINELKVSKQTAYSFNVGDWIEFED